MSRILVPCDGSPNSLYGVRHAAKQFLKNRELDIHVLNVQRPFSSQVAGFTSRRDRMAFHEEQADKALRAARQALDRLFVPYTIHTEVGDKADCIADVARRLRCDRIVMSTARKGSLVRWLSDSVTNRVIQRTTVPVEVIAGNAASSLERLGIPAGVGAGLLVAGMAAE